MSDQRSNKGDIVRSLLVGFVILATRLPWLSAGYGADPDSYRVANAARAIAATGQYEASRNPGYPVHEYVISVLVAAGPVATNFATALLSVVAFCCFLSVLRRFRIPNSTLISAAFALTPVIYVNSTCTIDYIWALAFCLLSTALVVRDRPILWAGGVSLGLAIGCRITSAGMLFPLVLYLWMSRKGTQRYRHSIEFLATALLAGFLCYVPVWARYGPGFLTFSEHGYPSLKSVVANSMLGVWGPLGTVLIVLMLAGVPIYWRDVKTATLNPSNRPAVLLSLAATLLYVLAYLRLPQESGYLAPVVPFVLLFAGLVVPRRILALFCIGLLTSSFIHVGRTGVSFAGPIVQDHRERVANSYRVESAISQVQKLPTEAIVVAGLSLPSIKEALGSDSQGASRYVYLISSVEELHAYQAQGYSIYFLKGQDDFNLRVHSVDLKANGALLLDALEKQ